MGGVGLVARAAIRRQWRGLVVIALLVGLAGTIVLATVAGARQTATALDRFDAYSRTADVEITAGDATRKQIDSFRHEPGVAAAAELRQMNLALPDRTFLPLAAAIDGRFGTVVDRPRVVEGRLPRQTAPLELAIGETLAKRLHVRVGGTARFVSFSKAQTDQAVATNSDTGPPAGPVVRFRVVGIVRRPLDLGVRGGPGGVVVPTPGFLTRYRDEIGSFSGAILRVRTEHGAADLPKVIAAARRSFGDQPAFQIQGLAVETEGAREAIDVLTIALWLFAAVAAVAGVVAIGIVASRQIESEERDQTVLASLGLTRRQRAAVAATLMLPAAVGGAALAVAAAGLSSPLLPFGVARQAEIDPGFHLDGLVLGLGVVVIVGFVLLVAGTAGRRVAGSSAARFRTEVARPSAAARFAAGAGVGPTVTTGLRMALEAGRGRTAVPVRSAFVGAVLGTMGIVAVLVFASSLDHLVATPRLYGWSFDAVLLPKSDAQAEGTACGMTNPAILRDPQLSAVSTLCILSVEVDSRQTTAFGYARLRGSIDPTVVAGRAPRRADEIALGATTLDALGKQLGDSVRVREDVKVKRYRIVGQVVFPSPTSGDAQPLADGAAITEAGAARLVPSEENLNTNIVARFADGVDPAQLPKGRNGLVETKRLRAELSNVPVEIARLQQVDALPTILGGLLALLATAAVGHAIVLGVRRRRRDLAVLRTLGFERSQVRTTVLCQASTHAVLGLLVGIPLGIVVGQRVWRAIADGLGVSAISSLSVLALLALAVATILVTTVIGGLVARAAIRTSPAMVFRSE
jgi:ABC-type lipoprotein release transport system permease subunit